jgi:hypothetical protein
MNVTGSGAFAFAIEPGTGVRGIGYASVSKQGPAGALLEWQRLQDTTADIVRNPLSLKKLVTLDGHPGPAPARA